MWNTSDIPPFFVYCENRFSTDSLDSYRLSRPFGLLQRPLGNFSGVFIRNSYPSESLRSQREALNGDFVVHIIIPSSLSPILRTLARSARSPYGDSVPSGPHNTRTGDDLDDQNLQICVQLLTSFGVLLSARRYTKCFGFPPIPVLFFISF